MRDRWGVGVGVGPEDIDQLLALAYRLMSSSYRVHLGTEAPDTVSPCQDIRTTTTLRILLHSSLSTILSNLRAPSLSTIHKPTLDRARVTARPNNPIIPPPIVLRAPNLIQYMPHRRHTQRPFSRLLYLLFRKDHKKNPMVDGPAHNMTQPRHGTQAISHTRKTVIHLLSPRCQGPYLCLRGLLRSTLPTPMPRIFRQALGHI